MEKQNGNGAFSRAAFMLLWGQEDWCHAATLTPSLCHSRLKKKPVLSERSCPDSLSFSFLLDVFVFFKAVGGRAKNPKDNEQSLAGRKRHLHNQSLSKEEKCNQQGLCQERLLFQGAFCAFITVSVQIMRQEGFCFDKCCHLLSGV